MGTLDSDERTRLFASESRALYAAPGYVLFNRADTCSRRRSTPTRSRSAASRFAWPAAPRSLAAGLNTSPAHARWAVFSVSQTGVFAYRSGGTTAPAAAGADEQRTLFWVDRARPSKLADRDAGNVRRDRFSPDGKRVAVHRHEGNGGDIWFFDAAQPRMLRLTFNVSQENSSPVWSPDGTQIAFGSQRSGKWGVYIKRADGSASEELITESDIPAMPTSWSPDGKLLVYTPNLGPQADIWAFRSPERGSHFRCSRRSIPKPSGRYLPTGNGWHIYRPKRRRTEIYVKPFPEGPGKWQVSVDGGTVPTLARRLQGAVLLINNNIYAADIRATGSSLEPGASRLLFQLPAPSAQIPHPPYNRYAVSADGQRFLISQPGVGAAVRRQAGC